MSPALYRLKIPGVSRNAAMLAWNPAPLKSPPSTPVSIDSSTSPSMSSSMATGGISRSGSPAPTLTTAPGSRSRQARRAMAMSAVTGRTLGARLVDRPLDRASAARPCAAVTVSTATADADPVRRQEEAHRAGRVVALLVRVDDDGVDEDAGHGHEARRDLAGRDLPAGLHDHPPAEALGRQRLVQDVHRGRLVLEADVARARRRRTPGSGRRRSAASGTRCARRRRRSPATRCPRWSGR